MAENFAEVVITQLLTQLPLFLVCILGVVLALVFWRRSRLASILVILGLLIHLVVVPVQVVLPQYLILLREDRNWTAENLSGILYASGMVTQLVRTLGLAFILAAVFVGRTRAATTLTT